MCLAAPKTLATSRRPFLRLSKHDLALAHDEPIPDHRESQHAGRLGPARQQLIHRGNSGVAAGDQLLNAGIEGQPFRRELLGSIAIAIWRPAFAAPSGHLRVPGSRAARRFPGNRIVLRFREGDPLPPHATPLIAAKKQRKLRARSPRVACRLARHGFQKKRWCLLSCECVCEHHSPRGFRATPRKWVRTRLPTSVNKLAAAIPEFVQAGVGVAQKTLSQAYGTMGCVLLALRAESASNFRTEITGG